MKISSNDLIHTLKEIKKQANQALKTADPTYMITNDTPPVIKKQLSEMYYTLQLNTNLLNTISEMVIYHLNTPND